jgi:hypothetical protein
MMTMKWSFYWRKNASMTLDFFDKHYYFWLPLSQRSTSMYPCPSICTSIRTPVITKVNIHMTSTSQYNMLLRFERKYFAIYEHDMFTVNIYFFIRISRVLCFFKHFLWFKLYKSDQFQFFIWVFFQSGNDSNVNLYYTIRFPLLYFSNVIYVFFVKIKMVLSGLF